tara:strand:+ start:266 stop:712 length:447 start_codon:yes stop_codon:yes gene_type:complete
MVTTEEVLNWVNRSSREVPIEVFVTQRVGSGMMFPKGTLSSRHLVKVKKMVEKYCNLLIKNYLYEEYAIELSHASALAQSGEQEVTYEWWADVEPTGRKELYLRAMIFNTPDESYDMVVDEIARIDYPVENPTTLAELKEKLFKGDET